MILLFFISLDLDKLNDFHRIEEYDQKPRSIFIACIAQIFLETILQDGITQRSQKTVEKESNKTRMTLTKHKEGNKMP